MDRCKGCPNTDGEICALCGGKEPQKNILTVADQEMREIYTND